MRSENFENLIEIKPIPNKPDKIKLIQNGIEFIDLESLKNDVCSKTPREYKCFRKFDRKDFHSDGVIVINRETGEYLEWHQTYRWLPEDWDTKKYIQF